MIVSTEALPQCASRYIAQHEIIEEAAVSYLMYDEEEPGCLATLVSRFHACVPDIGSGSTNVVPHLYERVLTLLFSDIFPSLSRHVTTSADVRSMANLIFSFFTNMCRVDESRRFSAEGEQGQNVADSIARTRNIAANTLSQHIDVFLSNSTSLLDQLRTMLQHDRGTDESPVINAALVSYISRCGFTSQTLQSNLDELLELLFAKACKDFK